MASPFYNPPDNCQVPDLGQKWETIFGRRTEGVFVEVGAYDGENFSNTSCLADVGWAGLYIEPIEEFAEQCRARHARNSRVKIINCAASDAVGSAQIFVGGTLTTLVGDQVADYEKIDWAKGLHRGESREIKTARLDDILDEQGIAIGFDVLVVDVEGAEEKVIGGFDIARWHPKVILIELEDEHPDFRDNARVVSSVAAIRDKLDRAGYYLYFKDHINSLYVRNDVSERISALTRSRPASEARVSIGLPTYNRPELIQEAIRSIENQTFRDFEVIISDNGSPDPRVAQYCIAVVERDQRFAYHRHDSNRGPAANFFFTFENSCAPLFMWASDDDVWEPDFLSSAVDILDRSPLVDAWMCHLEVIDAIDSKKIIREIPNLSRFSSSSMKFVDLGKFVGEPEVLGKANLIYSVFRKPALASAIAVSRPFINNWGGDMILIYAFLCRGNIKVDQKILFKKRAAASEVGFLPTEPRRHIVPWAEAGKFYGGLIHVSRDTRYHAFTHAAVRIRYLYDVLYSRIKLKQPAPWLPSRGARPTQH